jgi:hypothetical protein
MYQRTVYHDIETRESGKTCPPCPVFIEGVYLSTVIEMGLEVHVTTIDFRTFHYA